MNGLSPNFTAMIKVVLHYFDWLKNIASFTYINVGKAIKSDVVRETNCAVVFYLFKLEAK